MASTDTRGFRYALEPLRQRREWQLDKAMAALAALRQQLAQLRGQADALALEAAAQAAMATCDWQRRVDTATQSGLLAYLLRLQQDKARLDRRIAQVQAEAEQALQEAVRRQRGVETLVQHRTDELAAYRVEHERKSAAQADQDWLARSAAAGAAP